MSHFVSASCEGERCWCGDPATHKVGEEIPLDDPSGAALRHNLTAYVCCVHFVMIVGETFAPCARLHKLEGRLRRERA